MTELGGDTEREGLTMQEMTISEFTALVSAEGWSHGQSVDVFDRESRTILNHNSESGETVEREIPVEHGQVYVSSTLDEYTIIYTAGFKWDVHQPKTLALSTEGMESIWDLEGFCVLDDSGDALADGEIDALMPKAFRAVDRAAVTKNEVHSAGHNSATVALQALPKGWMVVHIPHDSLFTAGIKLMAPDGRECVVERVGTARDRSINNMLFDLLSDVIPQLS